MVGIFSGLQPVSETDSDKPVALSSAFEIGKITQDVFAAFLGGS